MAEAETGNIALGRGGGQACFTLPGTIKIPGPFNEKVPGKIYFYTVRVVLISKYYIRHKWYTARVE